MEPFYERLIIRAASVDELLSDDFEPLTGQKQDAERAGRRLAAWCQSCASGDWSLFGQRLARDGWTFGEVLARFATIRRSPSAAWPAWIGDATWIDAALRSTCSAAAVVIGHDEPSAFEHLFEPLVGQADAQVYAGMDQRCLANFGEPARACLRRLLFRALSDLAAPALYERFDAVRKSGDLPSAPRHHEQPVGTAHYDQFIADMRTEGFCRLFQDKPVLLRLVAMTTRQWIDTSRELIARLGADLARIREDILHADAVGPVVRIEGDLSDRHNGGRSVQIISFADGTRLVYKPKDLRVDAAWYALVGRLNQCGAPIDLRAARVLARSDYGWTEFIDHAGCADEAAAKRFFRRAGAWLALFHCFAATDIHQENIIAAGDHPVPIDLEMLLQGVAEDLNAYDPEEEAIEAARQILANSIMAVGLLPAYGRSPGNNVFAIGGLTSEWNSKTKIKWSSINTDAMRPVVVKESSKSNPNLPHVDGRYAKFADHIDDLMVGFADYAKFLMHVKDTARSRSLFDGFAGLPVRKVIRPTRFYHMLLQRLRNHRTMDDGAIWSAQADFLARLANWETNNDPHWAPQRSERASLVTLNVPHFVGLSDGKAVKTNRISANTNMTSGIDVARSRLEHLDEREIAWQLEVISENTNSGVRAVSASAAGVSRDERFGRHAPSRDVFAAAADQIAGELRQYAIRRGPGAAWIGLDWLGDAEVFQLVCLGPDLYNGTLGIGLFLAAHAAATGSSASAELALAAVTYLRKSLKRLNAARVARSFGVGGAVGLGSIVYGLAVISKCLKDEGLLDDAQRAARLFTDELIAADKQLDVMGGSAGGILGLIRLYRDTKSADALERALKCGEHLLSQPRIGAEGRRSWIGPGFGPRPLNGMSHGAAGFAYALDALAAVSGRQEFAQAAAECLAFEDSSYNAERRNWPDFRGAGEANWCCRWCHGAAGIGLARIATRMRGAADANLLDQDIRNAAECVKRHESDELDTLCCGALGRIEFLYGAAEALGSGDLCEIASRRLLAIVERAEAAGDYRWNCGNRKFNLGLFRGMAGVGYTLLRQVNDALPNVLIWE
jgi:type 2 lantibiotic biosynthesis protein LanM